MTYNPAYDQRSQSLSPVVCFNGKNNPMTRGFTTFRWLPKFPNIGGGFRSRVEPIVLRLVLELDLHANQPDPAEEMDYHQSLMLPPYRQVSDGSVGGREG